MAEEKKEKMVPVIATGVGHDGLVVRQPGEEFAMPESALAPRFRTHGVDGKKLAEPEEHPAPSWFKRKEEAKASKAAKGTQGGEDLV